MNRTERLWIEIICRSYPNLHNEIRVLNSSKKTDKKSEKVKKFIDRLDKIHNRVAQSHLKSDEQLLKRMYYALYVINEENIPEAYYESQARIARERGYGNIQITDEIRNNYAKQIIEDQKSSLDKWIEYFLYDEESKNYYMWEKYWVFQGIMSLGVYDKEKQKFHKRDSSTIMPFPEVNREAIFNTLKLMEEYIKDKKVKQK